MLFLQKKFNIQDYFCLVMINLFMSFLKIKNSKD